MVKELMINFIIILLKRKKENQEGIKTIMKGIIMIIGLEEWEEEEGGEEEELENFIEMR